MYFYTGVYCVYGDFNRKLLSPCYRTIIRVVSVVHVRSWPLSQSGHFRFCFFQIVKAVEFLTIVWLNVKELMG